MTTLADQIEQTVNHYETLIGTLDRSVLERKLSPDKWSKKEILGHLVDSAQNNLQRFVRGQYENTPKIIYSQDEWVKLQQYQDYNLDDLIVLWTSLNRHIAHTLRVMNSANYEKQCDTGKPGVELHSLKYLAEDYLLHMKHHLQQITA